MNRNKQIIQHLGFWFLFWIFQSLLWSDGRWIHFFLLKNIAIVSLQAALVYINLIFLYPYVFKKNYYLVYFIASALLLYLTFMISFLWIEAILDFAIRWIHPLPKTDHPGFKFTYPFWIFFSGSAPYSLALVCSLVWKIYRENEQNKSRAQELAMQKAQTEIQYLRSQINPHFLFNSLNNIHLLILKDQKLAAKYTLLLSDLLRYMLYEVKKDKTLLKNEIQGLNNYLQLMELKMENPEAQKVQIQIEQEDVSIVPLLLISLVENGIKHSGVEYHADAYLYLNIKEEQQQLEVKMENSIVLNKESKEQGIGMDNLKRRLSLDYPNQHHFSFRLEEQKAFTHLTLKLAE